MALADEVISGVNDVLKPAWNIRNGLVVPETKDIALKDGAVRLSATYLYADMANSTELAQKFKSEAVAKVIRCYLNSASRIIRDRGGAIRSFDGDRVMGIFIGANQESVAAKTALHIYWAVHQVINPALKSKWDDLSWTMSHGVGIDSGEALLVRGGVHGDNDIISIGSAPNVAAKLSELRRYPANISKAVYDKLGDELRKGPQGQSMWQLAGSTVFGGKTVVHYGSNWWWKP